MSSTQLGERLRTLRGVLSIRDVERETGISRIEISRYERGEKIPRPPNLEKLALFFEVPYEELRVLYYEDLLSDPRERSIVLKWAKQYL